MLDSVSVRSRFVSWGIVLLAIAGSSGCKRSDSEQKNFKAETGVLWWKKEATLVSLPYDIAKAPVAGQVALSGDAAPSTLEGLSEGCWYYSEKPGDPFFGAKAVSPAAVTLDTLLREMSEGEHKETLKALKDTWISESARVTVGLAGTYGGIVAGATIATVAALAVGCMVVSGGSLSLACLAISGKFMTVALSAAAAGSSALVPVGVAATVTKVAAVGAAGAVVGGVVGGHAGSQAGQNIGHGLTAKDFQEKLAALTATTSEDARKKVEWKQLQALNDIVMKAPSQQASARACAQPSELDRAAVTAFLGDGTSSPTTP